MPVRGITDNISAGFCHTIHTSSASNIRRRKQRIDWPLASYGLPPSPERNFVDHIFLKAYHIASILQHVSHLAMWVLLSNSLLHSLPLHNV